MAEFPLIRYIEREIPRFPTTVPVIQGTVVIFGTADDGPLTPILCTSESDLSRFVYREESEAVRLARRIIAAGGRVLFVRVIHPDLDLSNLTIGGGGGGF